MKNDSDPDNPSRTLTILVAVVVAACLLDGCGQANNAPLKDHKQPPYADVTSSSDYNFSSFAGTVWKTKVKLGLADQKQYTGFTDLNILVSKRFDTNDPEYTPGDYMQLITVLPIGTRLRIERLMEDQGLWGGVRVQAILLDVTNTQSTVYMDALLLSKNQFLRPGSSKSTNWDVDTNMLEKFESNTPTNASVMTTK